jgi:hypothetical protein
MWQAWQQRTRARIAETRTREATESRNPLDIPTGYSEALRRAQLAADPDGRLRRARELVREAEALARTPEEQFRAAQLRARIECDLDHHRVELKQAQRMMTLNPRDPRARTAMRHARDCNGLTHAADHGR